MKGQRFIQDRFANVNERETATAIMGVIDALQNKTPEVQVAACTAAFKLACKRFKQIPQNLLTIINNLMNDNAGRRPEFKAAEMYMEKEW